MAKQQSNPLPIDTNNLNPAIPCYLAETKQGQQQYALQQQQQQEYRVAPIFSDYLLVQPSREQQPITPVHHTIGVRALVSLNREVVRIDLQALKNRLTPDILKTKSRERQLVVLVG